MKCLICGIVFMISMDSLILFDFKTASNIQNWSITDDVVMGGVSSSSFVLNSDGHGLFQGKVSLENNGGFCALKYQFNQKNIQGYNTIQIRLKGDGKRYQFRMKANTEDEYSYITHFTTSGEWQEIEIPLQNMYAWFRGRKVNLPNFDQNSLAEIGFLIANKKEENFQLLIDRISLQ